MSEIEKIVDDNLTEFIVDLFILNKIKLDMVNRIQKAYSQFSKGYFITVKLTKNGNNIRLIIKITEKNKPKIIVVNHEYKFNSFIHEIVDYPI